MKIYYSKYNKLSIILLRAQIQTLYENRSSLFLLPLSVPVLIL
jgi:hypothetical protein